MLPPALVTTSIWSPNWALGCCALAFLRLIWLALSEIDNVSTTVLTVVSEFIHAGGIFLSRRSPSSGLCGAIQGAVIPANRNIPSRIVGMIGIFRNRFRRRAALASGASGAATILPAACSTITTSSLLDIIDYCYHRSLSWAQGARRNESWGRCRRKVCRPAGQPGHIGL